MEIANIRVNCCYKCPFIVWNEVKGDTCFVDKTLDVSDNVDLTNDSPDNCPLKKQSFIVEFENKDLFNKSEPVLQIDLS